MVEVPGRTTNDPALYEAILAQLSAAPLTLNRLTIDAETFFNAPRPGGPSTAISAQNADVIFWIEAEGTVYTINFRTKLGSDQHTEARELDLSLESELVRYDTIATAVTSLIDQYLSLLGYRMSREEEAPPPPEPESRPSPPPPADTPNRVQINLFAAYAGNLFAKNAVLHGIRMGLEVLPFSKLAVSVSYTQGFPRDWETSRYQLRLLSRTLGASVAANLRRSFVQLRLGLAWSVDLRSYALRSQTDDITNRPSGTTDAYALTPFIAVIFDISKRVGVVTGLGASIALNEDDYLLLRSDGSEYPVVEPLLVKLSYHGGLVFRF